MCKEVFEIVKAMDKKNVELQLLLQCAPTIAGLKTSNLLILPKEDEQTVYSVLKYSGLLCYRMTYDRSKVIFLVFNRRMLAQYVMAPENIAFLKEQGYESDSFGVMLKIFQLRYSEFVTSRNEFPHEMGIFLGYPLSDVTGFIENKGQNFKLSGYWKVYGDYIKTADLFLEFDQAKDDMIRAFYEGTSFREIINSYKKASIIDRAC